MLSCSDQHFHDLANIQINNNLRVIDKELEVRDAKSIEPLFNLLSVCAVNSLFIQFSPVWFVVPFIAFGGLNSG